MTFIKNHLCRTQIKKWILAITFFVAFPFISTGQTIYNNTFTGTGACPTQGNIPTVSANVTGTPFTRSTVTCTASAGVFNSASLNNSATVNNSSYIEFSVTANANAQLNVASLSFTRDASNSAPNQLEVRYSTDGFATSTSWGAAPNTPTAGASTSWDFADFSVPPGTTLTFRFYPYGTQRADLGGGASSGTTGTFSVDNVTLTGTNPLPVDLVSFTGKSSKNGVVINWVTAWEKENQGFEILKGTNAKSFETIGTVTGKLNTPTQSVYEFRDLNVMPGKIYYYRLKQNDVGGESALSKIISVQADAIEQAEAIIFPNPNNGSFTLLGQASIPVNIKLYGPSGLEIAIGTEESKDSRSLNIWARTSLPPGIYYLHINPNESTKAEVLKVLVQP